MIIDHRVIKLNNKVVFETLVADAPHSFSYPLQQEACFIHVKQGHNTAYAPDEIVEIPQGSLAFSNSGNLIFKSVPNEASGFYQATMIHIDKAFVVDSFASRYPRVNSSKKSNLSRDMLTGKSCVIMNNYIEGLLYYFDNRHMLNEDIIRLKTKEVILLLLQSKNAQQVSDLLENFVDQNTADFKRTIDTHLFHDISISDLAHLCNMSLSTFKRNFKKVYKATPAEYIFERRLEKSKKLLATSDLSLLDIALSSGFKTMSHYSRKFKEKFGIPPSQYKLTRSGK